MSYLYYLALVAKGGGGVEFRYSTRDFSKFSEKPRAKCLYIRFTLPTLLYAQYNVKLVISECVFNILLQKKQILQSAPMLNMLFATYDKQMGCRLNTMDFLAACLAVPYAAHGIGGILGMSILDKYYKSSKNHIWLTI